MSAIQKLRAKAQAKGTLKTTSEQKVIVQDQAIVIQPASPQVTYVPTYDPMVVYGAWPYPAYPPYYYYPPGYVAGAAVFSFAAGVAVGAAWGYAWGGCNWNHGDVNVNVNKNANINNQINRNNYAAKISTDPKGHGEWKHDPDHRKGVAYRDQGTSAKYGQAARPGSDTRKDFRGYSPDSKGAQAKSGGRTGKETAGGQGRQSMDTRQEMAKHDRSAQQTRSPNAFEGFDRGGSETKMASERGRSSRESMSGSHFQGAGRGGEGGGFGRGGGGGRRR